MSNRSCRNPRCLFHVSPFFLDRTPYRPPIPLLDEDVALLTHILYHHRSRPIAGRRDSATRASLVRDTFCSRECRIDVVRGRNGSASRSAESIKGSLAFLERDDQDTAVSRIESIVGALLGGDPMLPKRESTPRYEVLEALLTARRDVLRDISKQAYTKEGRRGSVEMDFEKWSDVEALIVEVEESVPERERGYLNEKDGRSDDDGPKKRARVDTGHNDGGGYASRQVPPTSLVSTRHPNPRRPLPTPVFSPHHDLPFHPRAMSPSSFEARLAAAVRSYDPESEAVVVVRIGSPRIIPIKLHGGNADDGRWSRGRGLIGVTSFVTIV